MMSLSKAYDLLIIILSLIVVRTSTAISPHIAKPGCSDRCGNVSIPFPFGIGANCALNEWYVIDCNSSTPHLSAALHHLEVLGIDLVNRTVTVNTPTSISDCQYGRPVVNSSSSLHQIKSVDLDDRSPFRFTQSRNKLVLEGCGNVVISHKGKALSGCSTICRNDSDARDKINCLGITCCETTIPNYYYLTSYVVELTGLEDRGGCGSAFFVDANLYVEGRISNGVVPVTLVWTLTYLDFQQISCCDFANSGYYEFMANRTYGYLTECYQSPDLEGNIYLRDGCAVKEECASCRANGGSCRYRYGLNFTCTHYHDAYPPSKKLSSGVILDLCKWVSWQEATKYTREFGLFPERMLDRVNMT